MLNSTPILLLLLTCSQGPTPDPRAVARINVYRWEATFYHRLPLLKPDVRRIGFGHARRPGGGCVTVLDAKTGVDSDKIIIFPPDKHRNIPLEYHGGEAPHPVPEAQGQRLGYPVSVAFPHGALLKNMTATLTAGRDRRPVPAWVSTPDRPLVKGRKDAMVYLLTKGPLKPLTVYTVTVEGEVEGAAWKKTWTFSTAAR
ncbi:MAG TPA: hypothetical protein VFA26_10950 [Gemmataceae bacterium]|nr:hypothetical protein [Gemmataceae bacterium]